MEATNTVAREVQPFDQLFEILQQSGDLKAQGVRELRDEMRVSSGTGGLVKKMLDLSVNADRLAQAISKVFDQRLYPFDRKPSELPVDAPRPALPKLLGHGETDQHVYCANSTVYMVNPFDRAAMRAAAAKYGAQIRFGVISFKDYQIIVGAAVEEQGPGASGADATIYKRKLDALIMSAVRQNASDIHFEPQAADTRVRLRVDNNLREVDRYSHEEYKQIANVILANCTSATAGSYSQAVDDMFVFPVPPSRRIKLRVAMLPGTLPGQQTELPVFCLRLLGNNLEQKGLAELGIPDTKANPQLTRIRLLCERKNGLILVSGPTGSGKTTTLSAILTEMQKTHPDRCRYTIEDPVEMSLVGVNHIQVNDKADLTFERGMKSFLRMDPDDIMLGEVRDLPVATTALTASITGHLVFSTIHTNSSIEAVTRLVDMGCDAYIVASALKAVTAQRLVRQVCPKCSEIATWGSLIDGSHPVLQDPENELMRLRYQYAPEMYSDLADYPKSKDAQVRIAGEGCAPCGNTGYKGRLLVTELFVVSSKIQDLIAKRASVHRMREQAVAEGFKEMWEHGASWIFRFQQTTMDEMFNAVGEREVTGGVAGATPPKAPDPGVPDDPGVEG